MATNRAYLNWSLVKEERHPGSTLSIDVVCMYVHHIYKLTQTVLSAFTTLTDYSVVRVIHMKWMKKSAQRRRKHCAPAVVRRSQNFRPAADPLPGGAGRPKFNQLEMVTTFTYKPSLVRIEACNFELSW